MGIEANASCAWACGRSPPPADPIPSLRRAVCACVRVCVCACAPPSQRERFLAKRAALKKKIAAKHHAIHSQYEAGKELRAWGAHTTLAEVA